MLSILAHLRQLHHKDDERDNNKNKDNGADDDFEQDGTLANYSGLDLFDKMDEEELVIDSPEQEPVEDEDLEDVDDNLKLGQSAAPRPVKDRDANREQVGLSVLEYMPVPFQHPADFATTQFLTYPESLPYQCESLSDMDAELDMIVQRICQAVQARDYDSM